MLQLFGIDTVLSLVGIVLGMVWTVAKAINIRDDSRRMRYLKALECLEAGVEKTYQVYVQELKQVSSDGKLTAEEQEFARQKAIEFAQQYATEKGINLLNELGSEYIPVLVSKIVKKAKH